jgi:hypothetical protein
MQTNQGKGVSKIHRSPTPPALLYITLPEAPYKPKNNSVPQCLCGSISIVFV